MNGKTAGGKTAGLLAAVAGLAATAALSGPSALAGADSAERTNNDLYGMGLSNHKIQRIVRFSTDNPEAARVISKVNGLMGDTKLVGFDYRLQNNRLYGVGDFGGVYTIRPFTGQVMKVSQIGVPLDGTNFGVDFNPAADRLRIISDTGQNLRHDVNAGGVTTVDGTLVYPPVPPAAPTTAIGVTAAAYTNNDLDDDTSVTLFTIDTSMDQVAIQSPANSGQLAATGKLNVDVGSEAGLDIYSRLDDDGTTTSVASFATLKVSGEHHLYAVKLLNGAATDLGAFPEYQRVVDVALPLDQS